MFPPVEHGPYTENNARRIRKGIDEILPALKDPAKRSLGQKIETIKKYILILKNIDDTILNCFHFLFAVDIDLIFNNRRTLRNNSSVSLSNQSKLFKWMKKTDILSYEKFKIQLCKYLTFVASCGSFTETNVKKILCYLLVQYLINFYIYLYI